MSRPRLLYLVTEDWYFMSHRLPMARAASEAGYEVHVATRVNRHGDAIRAEGFELHPVDLHRGSINPFNFIAAVTQVRRLYRRLAPAIVHHIALQPIVAGSAAAIGLPPVQVNSVLGFGSVFSSDTAKSRVARVFLRRSIGTFLNRSAALTLVLNPEDREMLIGLGGDPARIELFPGSGVDVGRFSPLPEPSEPITVGFVGRMLMYKGVATLVGAQQALAASGRPIRLLLAGARDTANPNSVDRHALDAWAKRPGVTWLDHVEDVRTVWARAHIAALASRSEGLPLSLLEAAACGRPIVASDVPGCREIARANLNALLVPPDDVQALAGAIARLADDAQLRRTMGLAGRQLVELTYSSEEVGRRIVAIYDRLVARLPAA